ncbi:MAG: hypothetical protein FWE48_02635 [Coriobacteriia bacterium]|nr:hypothetical protein [Coriobacteriia bacterium]MCL2745978.1 hypothetical protein [Coriobacteriia bacterium]MCL2870774.1 hypothetical protein [Coriobacteriia bacterium]
MKQAFFEAQGEALFQSGPFIDFTEGEVAGLTFTFGDDWEITDEALVLFAGGDLPAPRPVKLEDGRCAIPEAALAGECFTFTLIGRMDGRTVTSTNSIEVNFTNNTATEVSFAPVSVDLLIWLWEVYSAEGGSAGGVGDGKLTLSPTAGIPSVAVQQANPNVLYWEE